MTNNVSSFKRASLPKAFLCLFFRPKTYLDMAVSHGMAVELESAIQLENFNKGIFPEAGWEVMNRMSAHSHAEELRGGIWSALKTTLAFALTGIVLAAACGKVHPSLPLDWGKTLSVIGGLLAAWATLFELGGYTETWKEEALHEKLRSTFFRAAFLPGLIFATAGQLWWQ